MITRSVRAASAPALVAAFLALAGCQDSPTPPAVGDDFELSPGSYPVAEAGSGTVLRVEAEEFTGGGPVRLVLENSSGETVGYNLCVHGLERASGGGWSLLPSSRICTMELRLLESGDSATFDGTLPEDLAPGEHRVRIAVHFMETGRSRDLVSGPFAVE